MKYIYNINLNDDAYEDDEELKNISLLYTGESCFIMLDKNISLSSLISGDEASYDIIKSELESFIDYSKQEQDLEYLQECINFLSQIKLKSSEEFFSSFKMASIVGSNEDIVEYINKNPWLKGKQIIKNEYYELSDEGLKSAIDDVQYIKSKTGCEVSVLIEGNEDAITISEFRKVLEIIDKMVNQIKGLNMSPFEEMLYAYDLVRDHEYKKEDRGDYHTRSRDLSSVLLGDKIVCLGFVNIFNTILNKLGIPCRKFQLLSINNDKDNHVETVAYVKDDKYNLDALYLFDPTFDCKDQDNSYLTKYYYFGKTIAEMLGIYELQDIKPCCQYLTKSSIDNLEELLPDVVTPIEMGRYKLLKGLNSLLVLNGLEPIQFYYHIKKEEIIAAYRKISASLNKIIPIEAFTQAFTRVRTLEYYFDDNKFLLSKEIIEEATLTNSAIKIGISKEERDLLKVLKIEPSQVKRKRIKQIVASCIDEKKIAEIKLTRLLKNKLMTSK